MSDELQMIVSGIVIKENKPVAYVEFIDGQKMAEGIVPECKIIKNEGFEEDEIVLLEVYLKEHLAQIHDQAKQIDAMRGFMK